MTRRVRLLIFVFLSLFLSFTASLTGFAQATAVRDISVTTVAPGDTFTVTVAVTINQNINGLGLDENLPAGWGLTQVDNDGGIYSASETAWLWLQVNAGETRTVLYNVTVPTGTASGQYAINGVVKSASPQFENPVTGESVVTVEDQCTYAIDPANRHFDENGGAGTVSVTTSRSDCAWAAQKDVAWITITSGSSGTGNGTVRYTVATNSGAERTGHITIEGKTHTVTQDPNVSGGQCCTLSSGWNLISLPVEPTNTDPRNVFAYDPLFLTQYNTSEGRFDWVDKPASASGLADALTEVHTLGAYWLATQETGEYCVNGTSLTGNQAITMPNAGWYMIGVPYNTAWGDVTGASIKFTRNGVNKWLPDAVAAGWIYGTILRWNTTAGEWDRITVEEGTVLVPCLGYWIRTRVTNLVMTFTEAPWDPGNPPAPGTKSLKFEDPGNPPMPMPPTPKTFDPSKLEFTNYPNPITDVHTTTFAVKGTMAVFVEAIKVQIFNLSGRLVYEREEAGKSFDWHTDNDYGELLANGVYLYKLYAKVDGQWVVSDVRKLAILR